MSPVILSLFLSGSLGGEGFKGERVGPFLESSEALAKVSNFPEIMEKRYQRCEKKLGL